MPAAAAAAAAAAGRPVGSGEAALDASEVN